MIIVLIVKILFIFKSFSCRKIEENSMYLFSVKVLIKENCMHFTGKEHFFLLRVIPLVSAFE